MALQSYVFFFQAEDGIRDVAVTGVQTCALPISASLTAFHAGNRTLSAAPQNHHVPWTVGSDCGRPSWMVFSPAALTLLGVQSSSLTTENPASRHALLTDSLSATPGSSSAQAENITP